MGVAVISLHLPSDLTTQSGGIGHQFSFHWRTYAAPLLRGTIHNRKIVSLLFEQFFLFYHSDFADNQD